MSRCFQCFSQQDYQNIELVVIDDGDDSIKDLLPPDPRIRYYRELSKRNHGEKMNLCCELAKGDFVIVFDDDDFYAPNRVSKQIQPMLNDSNIDVTGTSRLYYYIWGTQQGFRYQNWTITPWLAAFAMRKSVWDKHKFEPLPCGADTRMMKNIPQERWKDLNDLGLLVATIHPTNASSKNLPNMSFIETPWEEIEKVMKGLL